MTDETKRAELTAAAARLLHLHQWDADVRLVANHVLATVAADDDGGCRLPNPLNIGFGEGRIAVATFTDSDGSGIVLRDSGRAHRVGDYETAVAGDSHNPQPGEVYLHFRNVDSAMVVREAIDNVIAALNIALQPSGQEETK